MLFNSASFLFIFLPITYWVWRILYAWQGMRIALGFLSFASLVFYSIWEWRYVFVLLFSIAINFWLGGKVIACKKQGLPQSTQWMKLGVAFNLLLLCGFKYTYFIAENLAQIFHATVPFSSFALPLAISFVTFQKIAYLVDCERGVVQHHHVLDYAFFVTFFPQLIAGPIVHHKPLIAQTRVEHNPFFQKKDGLNRAAMWGITLLSIGLFKKIVLADSFAQYVAPTFDWAKTNIPTMQSAWQASLAYTLQLYFDFSAYSDMAIGLAWLFGFTLPINFLSPYQATNIIEFWRRWHISLSSFLRDYLYIPLGGNRGGTGKRYRNLFLTMLLAGIWHGAGWTFMLWGALHGVYLLINHAWRAIGQKIRVLGQIQKRVPSFLNGALCFLAVVFAWVLFRSHDLASANRMLCAMWKGSWADWVHPKMQDKTLWLENFLGTSTEMVWIWIALGLCICFLMPNSMQIVRYVHAKEERAQTCFTQSRLMPQWSLIVLASIAFWMAMKWMASRPATEFLYFNF